MHRRVARILAVVLLTVLPAACSALPNVPSSDAILVSLEMSGGMCPAGACAERHVLRADGTVIGPDGSSRLLSPIDAARARAAVAAADFDAILARPFTGQCPVVYDGAEWTWTFHTSRGEVVVASCTTQIDPSQEPFATLTDLMLPAGG